MPKCKHANITIREKYVCWSHHEFNEGEIVFNENDSSSGTYTGDILVECLSCDYRRSFSRGEQRPKWVQALEDTISNGGEA